MNSWLRSQPRMIHACVFCLNLFVHILCVCVCVHQHQPNYCHKRMPIILKIRGEVGSCIMTAYMGVSCIVWRLPPLCVQNNRRLAREDRTTRRLAGDVACERPYGLNHSAAPMTGFEHTHTHVNPSFTRMQQQLLPGGPVYCVRCSQGGLHDFLAPATT